LTPNVTDIAGLALAAERGGADALSLVNTYQGLAVNWRKRKPELGSPTGEGGLSGAAIKPLALSALRKVRAKVAIPLVGIGGINDAEDVMEFMVTGATAVQVGTANFRDPRAPVKILEELQALVASGEVNDLTSMIGSLRYPTRPHR
jgi:dihydroorotate dehydrogenase (NAD+) catalytic subunit